MALEESKTSTYAIPKWVVWTFCVLYALLLLSVSLYQVDRVASWF